MVGPSIFYRFALMFSWKLHQVPPPKAKKNGSLKKVTAASGSPSPSLAPSRRAAGEPRGLYIDGSEAFGGAAGIFSQHSDHLPGGGSANGAGEG